MFWNYTKLIFQCWRNDRFRCPSTTRTWATMTVSVVAVQFLRHPRKFKTLRTDTNLAFFSISPKSHRNDDGHQNRSFHQMKSSAFNRHWSPTNKVRIPQRLMLFLSRSHNNNFNFRVATAVCQRIPKQPTSKPTHLVLTSIFHCFWFLRRFSGGIAVAEYIPFLHFSTRCRSFFFANLRFE